MVEVFDAGCAASTRAALFALLAITPFGCLDGNCAPPTKAELVPGTYDITNADDPDLIGGTMTLTEATLIISFERSAGPVEVVYDVGEQTY